MRHEVGFSFGKLIFSVFCGKNADFYFVCKKRTTNTHMRILNLQYSHVICRFALRWMKSFQQKKEELAALKDKLAKAKIVVFSSFARGGEKGLNVMAMGKLKKDLRAVESEYVVEKKTLLDKALKESKRAVDVSKYQGSLGAAFGYGDGQAVAKTIYGFAKKNPALKYFGAIWDGKFMDLAEFTEFAKLPAKDVMIARLLGMMKYPLSALANVLDQIAKKR